MKTVCLLIFGVVASATALVTAYHIDPKTAAMSGKASGNPQFGGVSQVLTTNFDELVYCEFFNGKGSNAGINVEVLTYPGGYPVASGDTNDPGDHKWLRCYLNTSAPESIVKGKKLEFRFTRSGSDSIQYYYDQDNPYEYGEKPSDFDPNPVDLCMRVYGRMNAVDSAWVGMDASFPTPMLAQSD